MTVDGPTLTATIAPGKHAAKTRAKLRGQQVRAFCISTYGDFKTVQATVLWPADADAATFTLDRDVSDRLAGSGCLLERASGGRDLAEVGFGPAPGRLFAISNALPRPATRRYLRIRDAKGDIVKTVQGGDLPTTLLPPGRYTLIRFERGCRSTCRKLSPPRIRCARTFRLKPGKGLVSTIRINRDTRRCRIAFKRDTQ